MTIFYRLGFKLYVNITNACNCDCIFCIRNTSDGVGDAKSLWLEREPSLDEIKSAFDNRNDLEEVDEIVFCGYGEPLERADDVVHITRYIKEKTNLPVRINTNGLVRLINPDFDISLLAVADSLSVSLNADDEEEYVRVSRPSFGAKAFREMLDFAAAVKVYVPNVYLTVVDTLEKRRIANCYRLAESANLPLRVRSYY